MLIKTITEITTKVITKFSNSYPYLLLLVWSIPLLLLQGNYSSLLAHDESYYATQARWIAEGSDWYVVQWWGIPIYDRALGLQWLIAISYKLFGRSEITTRLPNAVASLISILLIYSIGKRLLNSKLAFMAACLLPTMFLWLHNSHIASQDVILTMIELIGIYALLRVKESKLNAHKSGFGLIAGATLGLGFCLKSFMIVLFPIALLPYIYNQKLWRNLGIYAGIVVGAILPIAWLWASWRRFGLLPFEQLFGKLIHLRGSDPNLYNPDNSPIYYFWNLPANTLPWSILAIAGAFWIWQERKKFGSISLLLGYPLVLFCLLTIFPTRMPYYAIQILPFWSLFTAYALERLAGKNWFRLSVSILGLILVIASSLLTLGIVPTSPQIQPYMLFGFITGITWLGLYWFKYHHHWQFAILMPIWLAIAIAGLGGTFSDRSPEIRIALQQPEVANILNNQVVDFVIQPDLDPTDPLVWARNADHPNWLLFSFYTPKLGKQMRSVSELRSGSYAWVSPKSEKIDSINLIASIKEWQLIHIK